MIRSERTELLAPAGSYEAFRAGRNAGADAFYLGGERFGARAYADNFNKEILDKILPTNEKVNITDDQGDNKTSTDSPKVKVTEPVVEPTPTPTATPTATPTPDNTIIPDKELPKTGTNAFIIISAILAISSIGTFEYIKYKKQN